MSRCKAPETLRSEACLPVRCNDEGVRETTQIGIFQQPHKPMAAALSLQRSYLYAREEPIRDRRVRYEAKNPVHSRGPSLN